MGVLSIILYPLIDKSNILFLAEENSLSLHSKQERNTVLEDEVI